jgi:mycothiol synthase
MNTYLEMTDTIALLDAPAIPGLSFRGFRGPEDYPAMVAVVEGSKEVDQVERATTVEDIARDYDHLVNSDPYQDMLFAEMHGEVIGYSRVYWYGLADGTCSFGHFAALLPAWRGQGIRLAMLRHNEATPARDRSDASHRQRATLRVLVRQNRDALARAVDG